MNLAKVAAPLALAVVLAGCSSVQQVQEVQQSNEFVDSLNAAQQELVTVTSSLAAANDPASFAKAINKVLPSVEQKMAAVESAQASLPPDLQPIGATCVSSMETILKDLKRVGAAAKAERVKALNKAAAQLQEAGNAFGAGCVDPYNAAVASS